MRWQDVQQGKAACHAVRSVYHVGHTHYNHNHDFSEVFWLETGEIMQRTINDCSIVKVGEIVIVDPKCTHELSTYGRTKAVLINVAFPTDYLNWLSGISPDLAKWFLPKSGGLRCLRFSSDDLDIFAQWTARLAQPGTDSIELMSFLLDLIRRLRKKIHYFDEITPWLAEALTRLEHPDLMREGLNALIRITGRTRQHLARVLKRELGITPTELISQIRMRYAASQLKLTDKNVLTICHECGLNNPTHFYRVFKEIYGQTPNGYRKHI